MIPESDELRQQRAADDSEHETAGGMRAVRLVMLTFVLGLFAAGMIAIYGF